MVSQFKKKNDLDKNNIQYITEVLFIFYREKMNGKNNFKKGGQALMNDYYYFFEVEK